MKHKGFTLIELLVAIAVMAVLIAVALPNLLAARERARDVKLKSELNQLKSALRMYYNDYQKYPEFKQIPGNWPFMGCGSTGTLECLKDEPYQCDNFWFAAGGTNGCASVYMKKPPVPKSGNIKYYRPDADKFAVCALLENLSDSDIATSYNSTCAGYTQSSTMFCVCAD